MSLSTPQWHRGAAARAFNTPSRSRRRGGGERVRGNKVPAWHDPSPGVRGGMPGFEQAQWDGDQADQGASAGGPVLLSLDQMLGGQALCEPMLSCARPGVLGAALAYEAPQADASQPLLLAEYIRQEERWCKEDDPLLVKEDFLAAPLPFVGHQPPGGVQRSISDSSWASTSSCLSTCANSAGTGRSTASMASGSSPCRWPDPLSGVQVKHAEVAWRAGALCQGREQRG